MNMIRKVGIGIGMAFLLSACASQTRAPVASTTIPAATVEVASTVAPLPTAATVTPEAMPAATATGAMAGMDHGSMTAPFDALFIDSMTMHHQGAIDMAKDAQQKAQRPEIKQLAADIIKAQEAEIKQMQEWRKAWYPDLKDTGGMMMEMGDMMVKDGSEPYDIRFINAMIPHHQSAIAMSKEALQKAEKPEIKKLAQDIISAQMSEIEQMQKWKTEWTAST